MVAGFAETTEMEEFIEHTVPQRTDPLRRLSLVFSSDEGEPQQTLGASHCKRLKQIAHGKQRETKNSTPEVQVMADAMLKPPMHPRKQVNGFAEVRKNDHHKTSGTKYL
jgi:hypothetical protein